MIKTFNLFVYVNGERIEYRNISRVALVRFLEYYQNKETYNGYSMERN